jgi:hypothetical protein
VALGLVGRKGRDFFRRRGFVRFEQVGIFQKLTFADAEEIADAGDRGVRRRARRQRAPRLQRVQVGDAQRSSSSGCCRFRAATGRGRRRRGGADYLYEPSPRRSSTSCCRAREAQVYRALLESNAAFFAAQMTAMDAATRNSAEMIEGLTLYMNKVRQAAITREIIEVVSGAARRRRAQESREVCPGRQILRGVSRRRARGLGPSREATAGQADVMATETWEQQQQAVGKVVQVIGPVVDIEFEGGHLPEIYNAVRIVSDGASTGAIDVIAEVEQHLGENRVRAVAMKPTDGMQRGMRPIDPGAPISVPVGPRRSAAC